MFRFYISTPLCIKSSSELNSAVVVFIREVNSGKWTILGQLMKKFKKSFH